MTFQWGILGSGTLESTRRVRTLGLAASTRLFNELAVPGLGNVWFGKQLFLATLGVLVAERSNSNGFRVTKISVANAIEAVACWQALNPTSQGGDRRLRGRNKLAAHTDFSFANVNRPNFYVTQPMRMATVTALPAMGFVETTGMRFNSFSCSQVGLEFVEAVCRDLRPFRWNAVDYLVQWVCGQSDRVDSTTLRDVLSPLVALPADARSLLRERLHQGTSGEASAMRTRRSDALRWVESRRHGATPVSWEIRPPQITLTQHWDDLHAGALFFAARDAAIDVLDEVERIIATPDRRFSSEGETPHRLHLRLKQLRGAAKVFLDAENHVDEAVNFCRECTLKSDAEVLRHLVARDGRVLRLVGTEIRPGPAFLGHGDSRVSEELDLDESPDAGDLQWPHGISSRIRSLWWLSLDLEGVLDAWLKPRVEESIHV